MDETEVSLPPPEHDPAAQIRQQQQVRKRRLGMAFVSYLVTLSLVGFLYHAGLIELSVVITYALLTLAINGGVLLMLQSKLNLRLADPSMTFAQVVLSVLPPLWVIYNLDAGQARAIVLLIGVVPALYGIMALDTRRFVQAVLIMIALYGVLLAALWLNRPQVLSGTLEGLQAFALVVVLAQTAWLGGYINHLRKRLRERNRTLNATMAELNEAMSTIRDLANRDELTGLFNRRHLLGILAQEVNRYQRAQGPFSVCMMDVDLFKQVNDTYGHAVGDEVLRRIAVSVGETLRSIDCIGRYGGEEFMLVLPQTALDGAQVKAERIRAVVEALRFPELGEDFRVTVSIGVAQFQDASAEDTMRRADAALYAAKAAGRNRVVASDEPGCFEAGRVAAHIST